MLHLLFYSWTPCLLLCMATLLHHGNARVLTEIQAGPLYRVAGSLLSISCNTSGFTYVNSRKEFEFRMTKPANTMVLNIISTENPSFSYSIYRERGNDITLTHVSPNSVLFEIKSLQKDDEGEYDCAVINPEYIYDGIYSVQTIVKVIDDSLSVSSATSTSLSYNQDETLTLTCQASSNTIQHTHLSVAWYLRKEGADDAKLIISLDRDFTLRPGPEFQQRYKAGFINLDKVGEATYRLTIDRLEPSDSGRIYCEAQEWIEDPDLSWHSLTQKTAEETTLAVKGRVAPSPDSERHLEYVLKGQEINFLPSIPGKPNLVGWIHDGIDVVWFDLLEEYVFPPYEDRITLNQESARLIIKDATYEDSGNYDLKLMINGQHHRLKYRIEVIDKVDQPDISCVLTSPNRVLLVCSTESKHPDLLEFKWRANGKEHPGPNLQINVRGKHDDRVYRCDVSNPLTKETANFTAGDCFLEPFEKTKKRIRRGPCNTPDVSQDLKYVLMGQEINFKPSINEKPDLIFWVHHDGRGVVLFDDKGELNFPSYEDRTILNNNTAELTINNATYEDSGSYILRWNINNEECRLKYRVEVIDKVHQPHISCVLTSPNRVLLVCSTDSKHPHLLEFKWSANGKEHPGPNLHINVKGKHDDRVYRCDVSSPLTRETATFTAGDCFLDKPSDGQNDILKSKTTALIIGIIIILIIIIVIVITVVGLRKKARLERLKSCVLRRKSSTSEGLLGSDINLRQKVKDILKRQLDNIKRPNAVWHLDLCDALKPFGITNHGCIDVVSERIFWLKADNASNAPEVIANHFLDTVEGIGGCPQQLLADPHPENTCVRKVECFLRIKQKDQQNYIDECNTTNEQKESWLLLLCEKSFENWTKVFQNLKEKGLFTGSEMDKKLIKFCFLKPIQDKLNRVLREWNSKLVQEAAKDKLWLVSKKIVNKCKQKFIPEVQNPENEPVYERCRLIMAENGWNELENEEAAAELFGKLRNELLNKIPQQMPQITTGKLGKRKKK